MLCRKPCGKMHPPPEWLLVKQLNRITQGWTNFFSQSNAKASFSKLDHLVWWKLWKALRRRHKKRGREWTVKTFLKRPGGKWQFTCHGGPGNDEALMNLFAEKPITRHVSARHDRSYYDGDWAYWATRLGHYPSIPKQWAKLLKRQRGKCHSCGIRFTQQDRLALGLHSEPVGDRSRLTQVCVHAQCLAKLRRIDSSPAWPGVNVARSPVR
jgi:RNA-directed DNA polymerase